MIENKRQLKVATEAYYANYYWKLLGLRDWRRRVEMRMDEESLSPKRVLAWIEAWLNYSFADKKVLVLGGGTGAETFALHARGARVTAIEPNGRAVEIIEAKARLLHNVPNPAVQAVGESLPYSDDCFDFVYCFTVLEHTQHPLRCVDEMIRVVRKRGWVFIETPDYRHPREPHYKMFMPTIAPRWVLCLLLKLFGRPTEFLDTLQFLNARSLRNAFQLHPVTAFQVVHSWPGSWFSHATAQSRLCMWITQVFGIQRDQWWLLQKLEKPR